MEYRRGKDEKTDLHFSTCNHPMPRCTLQPHALPDATERYDRADDRKHGDGAQVEKYPKWYR